MLVGTSAPTNQPDSSLMNLPQYSGMDPSNSTSSPVSQFSGAQPQLENQYKRLRVESLSTIDYTPHALASDNLNRSSLATQHGPGVDRIGGQTQFGLLAGNHSKSHSKYCYQMLQECKTLSFSAYALLDKVMVTLCTQ